MNLTDDEVLWISTLLYTSKSKLIGEHSEIRLVKQKIHSMAGQICAKKARTVLKPGKFS